MPSPSETAENLAKQLSEIYGVPVGFVDTDDAFYAAETIKHSALEKTYFISLESPEQTAKTLAFTLEYDRHRAKNLSSRANAPRTQKAQQFNTALATTIEEVKDHLRDQFKVKEPTFPMIAAELNKRKIPGPSGEGSIWYPQTVKRVVDAVSMQLSK